MPEFAPKEAPKLHKNLVNGNKNAAPAAPANETSMVINKNYEYRETTPAPTNAT